MEFSAIVDGSFIIGMLIFLGTGTGLAFGMYYGLKMLRKDVDADKEELNKFKKEVRDKLDKLEDEFNKKLEKHEAESKPYKETVIRIEEKLDNLIDRIDRAGVNGHK